MLQTKDGFRDLSQKKSRAAARQKTEKSREKPEIREEPEDRDYKNGDTTTPERLLKLQQCLQKPLPEILQKILAQAIDATELAQETEGQKIYRLFDEAGLVGYMEGDGQLSVNYKEHLWGSE